MHSKCDKSVRSKCDRIWSWGMEEKNWEGGFGRRSGEDGKVTVWMEAANEFGAGRLIDAEALGAQSDPTVGTDLCGRALAPGIRPPGATWDRT